MEQSKSSGSPRSSTRPLRIKPASAKRFSRCSRALAGEDLRLARRLRPHILKGRLVTLEPLGPEHESRVGEVFASDRDAWNIMVHNGGPAMFDTWWTRTTSAMASGESIIFAVLVRDSLVGTTGFYGIDHNHRRVEIGSTFYHPKARSTGVNLESKLLLLKEAFRAGAVRVEFVSDALNLRSRAALRKIGAVEEGILRRHKITWTGRVRDTAIYSITDEDWPAVEKGLRRQLAALGCKVMRYAHT